MSKSSHAVKIQKGSTTYTCDLYTTTAEARSNLYPSYPLFRVTVDGTNLYAPFTTTLNSATESTPFIYNTNYCLAQHSFFAIGITTKSYETITVKAGGQTWTSGTKWFPYGTTWTASVSPSAGWNAGAISPASSGTLTNANVTVTAGNATHKNFTLTLAATSNQTITLKYKNYNGSSYATEVTKTSTGSAQSFTVGYGTTWTATLSAKTGYNKGSLSASSGTVTGNTTVSATAANPIQYYLRYNNSKLVVKKNNSSGATISSGSKVNYNQTVYVSYSGNYDSIQYYLYKNSGASGTIWLKKFDVDSFTFNMPTSQIFISVTPFTGGGN